MLFWEVITHNPHGCQPRAGSFWAGRVLHLTELPPSRQTIAGLCSPGESQDTHGIPAGYLVPQMQHGS